MTKTTTLKPRSRRQVTKLGPIPRHKNRLTVSRRSRGKRLSRNLTSLSVVRPHTPLLYNVLNIYFICTFATSAKEGMIYQASVCPSVGLRDDSIFVDEFWRNFVDGCWCVTSKNGSDVGGDPVHVTLGLPLRKFAFSECSRLFVIRYAYVMRHQTVWHDNPRSSSSA